MMAKAGRYHAQRGVLLALTLLMATLVGFFVRSQILEADKVSHAEGLVQQILSAETTQVSSIIPKLDGYRLWADPRLREENERALDGSRQKLHMSLALLPVDDGQVEYLYKRLLNAGPAELPVIRDALKSHRGPVAVRLWGVLEDAQADPEQRFRAACALASYDNESAERWAGVSTFVADGLLAIVQQNPSHFMLLMETLRPIRDTLISPLSSTYRSRERGEAERSWATNILAEYVADAAHLELLANLLMDGNEKQFAVLYPKLSNQREASWPILHGELAKQVKAHVNVISQLKDTITMEESLIRVRGLNRMLHAKVYPVEMKPGRGYTITMKSSEPGPLLVLEDPTGQQLPYFDTVKGSNIVSLSYTPPSRGSFKVIAMCLNGKCSFSLDMSETDDQQDAKEELAKRQANAAVALFRMERLKLWPLLRQEPDPRLRSYIMHRLNLEGVEPDVIIHRLNEEADVTIRRSLLLILGEFDADRLPGKAELILRLLDIYSTDPDPGVHGAAEWLLRNWKQDDTISKADMKLIQRHAERLRDIRKHLETWDASAPGANPVSAARWYMNSEGQTIVVVPQPPLFKMGSPPTERGRREEAEGRIEHQHETVLTRSFAITAKAITVEEFLRFRPEHDYNKLYADKRTCPINVVTWYDAAAYCNWLSKKDGLEPVYEPNQDGEFGPGMKFKANHLQLSGYRLPTEVEWEYACRAGSVTSRHYGETEELLSKYAWYDKHSMGRSRPVGGLKPNDLGLFDMLGNVNQWCESRTLWHYEIHDDEDVFDRRPITNDNARALRGSCFSDPTKPVRCAWRYASMPNRRNDCFGFRLARTVSAK
jgi:formylglycine-generating enzyme required for sulfatase activity